MWLPPHQITAIWGGAGRIYKARRPGNEFPFSFCPFTLKLAYGLSLVNYTGFAQCCLAVGGRFWAAWQLVDCHIHLPVRLVAVGRWCLFHLYIDCDISLSCSRRAGRILCGYDRSQEIRSKLARLNRRTFWSGNRSRSRHFPDSNPLFRDPARCLPWRGVVRVGNGILPRKKGGALFTLRCGGRYWRILRYYQQICSRYCHLVYRGCGRLLALKTAQFPIRKSDSCRNESDFVLVQKSEKNISNSTAKAIC